ncbi:MAG: hypothetical protein ACXWQO_08160 [Bdellovibrionota bacterium]
MKAIMHTKLALAFLLLSPSLAEACATRGPVLTSKAELKNKCETLGKERLARNNRKVATSNSAGPMPLLPEENSSAPWGGTKANLRRSEAIIANAASHALNEAWDRPNVTDVIVALPVKMQFSNERPYGDGQTNASASLGEWNGSSAPLVASLILLKRRPSVVSFRVAKDLLKEARALQITYFVEAGRASKFIEQQTEISLSADPSDSHFLLGEWKLPDEATWGDLFSSRVAFLRPKGWADWFPLDFRHPVVSTDALAKAAGNLKLSGGRSLLDPEKIFEAAKKSGQTPFEVLLNKAKNGTMGAGFNQNPYTPPNVHAWFPENNAVSFTAVGRGWTWVVGDHDTTHSPLKNLYTCFERRQPEKEAESLSKVVREAMNDPEQAQSRAGRKLVGEETVTSGGGWHEIGDFAETIINDLESEPIVVGMATGLPWPTPPSGKYAYGLSDVATIRWLDPGDAMITPAGDQTLKEKRKGIDANISGGRNYHWFYFQQDREVCTQEFVHNCVPSPDNSLGLNCK